MADVSDTPPPWARELADTLERTVGSPPLNDAALSRLEHPGHGVRHLSLPDRSGYAQLVPAASGEPAAVEIAASGPAAVEQLLATAEALTAEDLSTWSHGRTSPVGAVAAVRGYRPVRELRQLRMPVTARPDVPAADGVRLTTFVPGRDEQEWLAVNTAAFAFHPEQGRVELTELTQLEAESWFDAAGFLLARDTGDDRLLGYHWTKRHTPELGEVYVLGIAPDAQGRGLGRLLLQAGLAHLYDGGSREVLLYVEGDNRPALTLYERAGFTLLDTDTRYLLHRT